MPFAGGLQLLPPIFASKEEVAAYPGLPGRFKTILELRDKLKQNSESLAGWLVCGKACTEVCGQLVEQRLNGGGLLGASNVHDDRHVRAAQSTALKIVKLEYLEPDDLNAAQRRPMAHGWLAKTVSQNKPSTPDRGS
ncbi:hypothetical protein IWZ01DRAFT_480473 [Phyllosticta capitalensis]